MTNPKKEQDTFKIIVLFLNFGGPDSLEGVAPFLFQLFSDAFIIKHCYTPSDGSDRGD